MRNRYNPSQNSSKYGDSKVFLQSDIRVQLYSGFSLCHWTIVWRGLVIMSCQCFVSDAPEPFFPVTQTHYILCVNWECEWTFNHNRNAKFHTNWSQWPHCHCMYGITVNVSWPLTQHLVFFQLHVDVALFTALHISVL